MRTAKIVIGLVAIGFLGGLLGGYSLWKPKEGNNADLQQLLAKAGSAADQLIRRNEELASRVEALKGNAGEAEALKAENLNLHGQLDNTAARLEGQISTLDNQVRNLQGRLERQQQEIAQKESRNARLKEELSAALQETQRHGELKARVEELRNRISVLEQENGTLRSVLDNISALTRKKKAAQ
jgi:chromosome segregation ATPase